MQKICNGLNEVGLRSIRGNKFTVNSMHRILTNRAYIGEYHFGDVIIPDGMPRLIDDVIFQAVQAKLVGNRRGGKGAMKKAHPEAQVEDYWLSGKMYCGLCGGAMQGVSGTSRAGNPYYYYSCKNHRKHACTLRDQRKELMEMIVLYTLDDLIHDPALRLILADMCYAYHMSQNDDNGAYEASIKTKLKEVEDRLANIMRAIEAGIFNETTAERMKVLESQKSMLNDALLAEQNRRKFSLTPHTILKFFDAFIGDLNDPDTRRNLLNVLIDKIYAYPDKLAITSHYSDDRRELPFKETIRLIAKRRTIMSILTDHQYTPVHSELYNRMLESLLADPEDEEGNSDFFP